MPDEPRLKRYVRSPGGVLALILAGGVVIGTIAHRNQTVEEALCDAATEGPRVYVAVEADESWGQCIAMTPRKVGSGKTVWLCWCRGDQCCVSPDEPGYLCSEPAECAEVSKNIDGESVGVMHLVCAIDPQGCREWNGAGYSATPCRKPVIDIPLERRPTADKWSRCTDWAPRERE